MSTPGPGDARVADVLRPVVEAGGHHLEGVTTTPAGSRRVVRVVVDLPDDRLGTLDLDAVAVVSRAVSDALDASSVLGTTPYVLEVTTPGVDRPLTERRHWARARTRLVEVPVDGEVVTGRLLEVDDAGVVLDVDGTRRSAAWASVGTGRVQVEFRRPATDPAAADPDDPEEED